LAEAQKGQKNEAVNFIALPSPEYDGAFRFEAANRKGCLLAFTLPSRLGVIAVDKDEDQSAVFDFMLVDFTVMSKFIDVEEVLTPVMRECGTEWVQLSSLRDHVKVKSYFETVLQKPMWEIDDFASYFDGHWATWEYRAADQCVRIRPSSEKLGQLLAAASGADEAASVISGVGDELTSLTLAEVEQVMRLLLPSGMQTAGIDAEPMKRRRAAWERLVDALQTVARKAAQQVRLELSVDQLLDLREQVLGFSRTSSQPS
jgi:hypothetical protein